MANTIPPPPGAPEGGIWGTNKYVGSQTQMAACVGFLCFCLPGLLILCIPCDERDAYKVNGKVYTADGKVIPDAKFIAKAPPATQAMNRE